MGRMTRKKAAEVAEQLHIDEDELLAQPLDESVLAAKTNAINLDASDRPPLGELAPNSADSNSPAQAEEGMGELRKSTRGKKGRKGATKKTDLAASTASRSGLAEGEQTPEVVPDDNDSLPSPASEKAAQLLRDASERKLYLTV